MSWKIPYHILVTLWHRGIIFSLTHICVRIFGAGWQGVTVDCGNIKLLPVQMLCICWSVCITSCYCKPVGWLCGMPSAVNRIVYSLQGVHAGQTDMKYVLCVTVTSRVHIPATVLCCDRIRMCGMWFSWSVAFIGFGVCICVLCGQYWSVLVSVGQVVGWCEAVLRKRLALCLSL